MRKITMPVGLYNNLLDSNKMTVDNIEIMLIDGAIHMEYSDLTKLNELSHRHMYISEDVKLTHNTPYINTVTLEIKSIRQKQYNVKGQVKYLCTNKVYKSQEYNDAADRLISGALVYDMYHTDDIYSVVNVAAPIHVDGPNIVIISNIRNRELHHIDISRFLDKFISVDYKKQEDK